ncbi:MAG: DUF4177 domain-containing protein [Oscillatoriaceae cyanobacterium Prado104]|jgi:hypothetical protein|nr:DUF4177 domain-containing protein [Oscillatoriaceae cyanobacterium Prado104]
MAHFEYQILVGKNETNVPTGVVWLLNGQQQRGPNLLGILNELGSQGWEVVGIGDLGFDSRVEILLKKTI